MESNSSIGALGVPKCELTRANSVVTYGACLIKCRTVNCSYDFGSRHQTPPQSYSMDFSFGSRHRVILLRLTLCTSVSVYAKE